MHATLTCLPWKPLWKAKEHVVRSVLGMVDTCLEQDLATFKASCQDMVDELEELRRRCSEPAHRARITRLLFIITRCSRLVFTGLSGCFMVQAAVCMIYSW